MDPLATVKNGMFIDKQFELADEREAVVLGG